MSGRWPTKIKVCVVCGAVDVDQRTCNSCRRRIAYEKKGKLKKRTVGV